MAATEYSDPRAYLKFLKKKCTEELEETKSPCGCNSAGGESCNDCSDDCSCCPAGTVGVYDEKGNHLGCLTPNDAELFQKNTFTCDEGYVKLIKTSDGSFLGCVSEDSFADLYTKVNP
jgi:hypothetical protein